MAEHRAYFEAFVAVEFDPDEQAPKEAFDSWCADNDVTERFSLTRIENEEGEQL